MARFAIIGDIHGHQQHLNRVIDLLSDVSSLDGLLLVGDLTGGHMYQDRLSELDHLLDRCGSLGLPLLFVPGNHDQKDINHPGNIDRKCVNLSGIDIVGIGGTGPMKFGFPYEWDDDDVRGLNVDNVRVILSHTPPVNSRLDTLADGVGHGGSGAIREYAERCHGALVCGHIHEAVGAEVLGSCLCYNAGSLAHPFGSVQFGILDVDASSPACRVSHFDSDGQELWSIASP